MVSVKFKKLCPDAVIPTYAHGLEDAGMDLYALEEITLFSMQREKLRTGLALEIQIGAFGLTRPRSGLASKGLIMSDSGVIDSGYRGELKVCLWNSSNNVLTIPKGARFAQLIILPRFVVNINEVHRLESSRRGQGGYGSTGV